MDIILEVSNIIRDLGLVKDPPKIENDDSFYQFIDTIISNNKKDVNLPNNIVSLFTTSGQSDNTKLNEDSMGMQVIIKATDRNICLSKAEGIYKALHGLSGIFTYETDKTFHIREIIATAKPFLLQVLEDGTCEYTINFNIFYQDGDIERG